MEIYFFNERTRKFFDSLDGFFKAHSKESFKILEEKSYTLGLPVSRSLGRGLFELRVIDNVHIRFLYSFHADCIWILHGFIKKTNQISNQDMRYARNELKKLLQHYNG